MTALAGYTIAGGAASRQGRLVNEEIPRRPGEAHVPVAPRPAPRPPAPDPAAAIRPVARPARLRSRHRGLIAGFVLMVLVPFALSSAYLFGIARDQYASTAGFTVRTEETGSASEILGGLGGFIPGNTGSNGNVLNAFMQSAQIVASIDARLDLTGYYGADWLTDPVFSLWPGATIEDAVAFWRRMVRISFDPSTGLMDIQVRARTPEMAQAIAAAIVDESEVMINALNEQARRDTMANAQRDIDAALERLRAAREATAAFRAETQIVDPQADIQGRMGVINSLQQQLAQALIDHDVLLMITTESDPRVRQAMRRIEVIRDRIAEERSGFAVSTDDSDAYPRLIARFESLRVDQEFAEQTYRAALTAFDAARSNAARQSLYLATYIRPTLAQRAEYPERALLSALIFGFLFMVWSITALVYYSLRDRG
jgi:capsular polysaccharide transport system permease protein